mgnify:CR=1 FL=1|tara:strand:- start:1130 stop:1933 length:804 start_codon:yes stop_codon:yes gene_type:complete
MPEIIYDMAEADYRAAPCRNASSLKDWASNPQRAKAKEDAPDKATPAMITGRMVHQFVLEPKRFKKEHFLAPDCKRNTKAGRELWEATLAANPKRTPVMEKDWVQFECMREAALAHPKGGAYLKMKGKTEVSIFWEDEATGQPCKGRIDKLTDRGGIIVDLKTCQDASPRAVARQVNMFNYALQAAFYTDGLMANGFDDVQFIFVFVEKTAPWSVSVVQLSDDYLAAGRKSYYKALENHKACHVADCFPGWDEIITLERPKWVEPWE